MNSRACLLLAAIFGFFGVTLGAFGAHGLQDAKGTGFLERKYSEVEDKLIAGYAVPASYKYLRDFETGVDYHLIHALALAVTGILMRHRQGQLLRGAAWCFAGGTVLFSGALYVLVIGGPRWLGIPWGAIAPIGGTLLLLGWLLLAAGAWRTTTFADTPAHAP